MRVEGSTVLVEHGAVGAAAPLSSSRAFGSRAEAEAFVAKQRRAKCAKGFVVVAA